MRPDRSWRMGRDAVVERGVRYTRKATEADFAWLCGVAARVAESAHGWHSASPVVLPLLLSRKLGERLDSPVVQMGDRLFRAFYKDQQPETAPGDPNLKACFSNCLLCDEATKLTNSSAPAYENITLFDRSKVHTKACMPLMHCSLCQVSFGHYWSTAETTEQSASYHTRKQDTRGDSGRIRATHGYLHCLCAPVPSIEAVFVTGSRAFGVKLLQRVDEQFTAAACSFETIALQYLDAVVLKEPTLSDTLRNNFTSELQGMTHNFTTELQKAYVYYTLLQQLHRAGRARAEDRVETYLGSRGHLLEDIVERHVDTLRYEFDALYVGQHHKLCPHAECHRDIVVDGNEKAHFTCCAHELPKQGVEGAQPVRTCTRRPQRRSRYCRKHLPSAGAQDTMRDRRRRKNLCLVAGRMPTVVTP